MLRQTHIEDSFEIPLPSHSNTNKTFKGRETREELSMTRKIGRLVWLGYVFFIIMYVWNYEETPFNPQEFQETNPPIYVVPWIYDRTLGKWNLITNYPPEIIPKSKLTSEDEISIISYNIWTNRKSEKDISVRYQGVLQLLKEADADIICLQEVTISFINLLLTEDWVKYKYWVSDSAETFQEHFRYSGQFILSAIPITGLVVQRLPVGSKKALFATFEIDEKTIAISNIQLEGYTEGKYARRDQLGIIFDLLKTDIIDPTPYNILLGDFSFKNELEREERISSTIYLDMWKHFHSDSTFREGWTWNPEANGMLEEYIQQEHKGDTEIREPRRKDFIFLTKELFEPKSISLFGTSPISSQIFPSIHFGLLGVFKVK